MGCEQLAAKAYGPASPATANDTGMMSAEARRRASPAAVSDAGMMSAKERRRAAPATMYGAGTLVLELLDHFEKIIQLVVGVPTSRLWSRRMPAGLHRHDVLLES